MKMYVFIGLDIYGVIIVVSLCVVIRAVDVYGYYSQPQKTFIMELVTLMHMLKE